MLFRPRRATVTGRQHAAGSVDVGLLTSPRTQPGLRRCGPALGDHVGWTRSRAAETRVGLSTQAPFSIPRCQPRGGTSTTVQPPWHTRWIRTGSRLLMGPDTKLSSHSVPSQQEVSISPNLQMKKLSTRKGNHVTKAIQQGR